MDPQEWFDNVPPITKFLLLGSIGITFAANLDLCSPYSLILTFDGVFHSFQIWRLATAFLFNGKLGFPFLLNMIFLYRQSRQLEEDVYRGRASDYLFMILFGSTLLLLVGFLWPFPILGQALQLMLTYYWSRMYPNLQMNFFGITFRSIYLSWFIVGLNFIMGGSIPILMVLGILVGHVYFFFEHVLPNIWHRRILKTPWFLYSLFPPRYNENSPDFIYARGVGRGVRQEAAGFRGHGYQF